MFRRSIISHVNRIIENDATCWFNSEIIQVQWVRTCQWHVVESKVKLHINQYRYGFTGGSRFSCKNDKANWKEEKNQERFIKKNQICQIAHSYRDH